MFKRSCAIITLLCFTLTFIVNDAVNAAILPSQPEQDYRQALDACTIPSTVGRITAGRYFGSGRVVINIQDLHCHPEVQRNIARILGELDDRYRLDTVYLEGGYGNVDTSWLTSVKDPALRKDVLEAMLDQGRLTGAEYYAIANKRTDLLKGIEDERIHRENIERLGRILDRKTEFEHALSVLDRDIEFMQAKYFNQRNQRFNAIIGNYRSGKMPAEKFYGLLLKYAGKINAEPAAYSNTFNIRLNNYPNITGYLALMETGQRLNYRSIARQLQLFMAELKHKLPFSVYNGLLEQTDNFSRLDKLYVLLSRLTKERSLDAGRKYPDLNRFFAYVDLSQDVNPVQMIAEEKRLIEEIRLGFSQDVAELEISFAADFYAYFKDYLFNRLSAADYQYFTERFGRFQEIWAKYTYVNHLSPLKPYFPFLDEYYRVNAERNDVFISKMLGEDPDRQPVVPGEEYPYGNSADVLKRLDKDTDIIVVVTGGFHSEGLQALLTHRCVSYLSITPNVTKDTKISSLVYEQLARRQARSFAAAPRQDTSLFRHRQSPFELALNAMRSFAHSAATFDFRHSDALGLTVTGSEDPADRTEAVASSLGARVAQGRDLDMVIDDINRYFSDSGLSPQQWRAAKKDGRLELVLNGAPKAITIDGAAYGQEQQGTAAARLLAQVPASFHASEAVLADVLSGMLKNVQLLNTPENLVHFYEVMFWLAEHNIITGEGTVFELSQSGELTQKIGDYFKTNTEEIGKLPDAVQRAMIALVNNRERFNERLNGAQGTLVQGLMAAAYTLSLEFVLGGRSHERARALSDQGLTRAGKAALSRGIAEREYDATLSPVEFWRSHGTDKGALGRLAGTVLITLGGIGALLPARFAAATERTFHWRQNNIALHTLWDTTFWGRPEMLAAPAPSRAHAPAVNPGKLNKAHNVGSATMVLLPLEASILISLVVLSYTAYFFPAFMLSAVLGVIAFNGLTAAPIKPYLSVIGYMHAMDRRSLSKNPEPIARETMVQDPLTGDVVGNPRQPHGNLFRGRSTLIPLEPDDQSRMRYEKGSGTAFPIQVAPGVHALYYADKNSPKSHGFVLGMATEKEELQYKLMTRMSDEFENIRRSDDPQIRALLEQAKIGPDSGAGIIPTNVQYRKLEHVPVYILPDATPEQTSAFFSGFEKPVVDEKGQPVRQYSPDATYWVDADEYCRFIGVSHTPMLLTYDMPVAPWRIYDLPILTHKTASAWEPYFAYYGMRIETDGRTVKAYREDTGREVPFDEAKRIVLEGFAARILLYLSVLRNLDIVTNGAGPLYFLGSNASPLFFEDISTVREGRSGTVLNYLFDMTQGINLITTLAMHMNIRSGSLTRVHLGYLNKFFSQEKKIGKKDLLQGIAGGVYEMFIILGTSPMHLFFYLQSAMSILFRTYKGSDEHTYPQYLLSVIATTILCFAVLPHLGIGFYALVFFPAIFTVRGLISTAVNDIKPLTAGKGGTPAAGASVMLPGNEDRYIAGILNGARSPFSFNKMNVLGRTLNSERRLIRVNWGRFDAMHGPANAERTEAIRAMHAGLWSAYMVVAAVSVAGAIAGSTIFGIGLFPMIAVGSLTALFGYILAEIATLAVHVAYQWDRTPGAPGGKPLAFVLGDAATGQMEELKNGGFMPVRVKASSAAELKAARGLFNFGFGQRGYWASADDTGVTVHVLVREDEDFMSKAKDIIAALTGTGHVTGNARVLRNFSGKINEAVDPRRTVVFGDLAEKDLELPGIMVAPLDAVGFSAAALSNVEHAARKLKRLEGAVEITLTKERRDAIVKAERLDDSFVLRAEDLIRLYDELGETKARNFLLHLRGKSTHVYVKCGAATLDGLSKLYPGCGIDGIMMTDEDVSVDRDTLAQTFQNPSLIVAHAAAGSAMAYRELKVSKDGITQNDKPISVDQLGTRPAVFRIILGEEAGQRIKDVLKNIPAESVVIFEENSLMRNGNSISRYFVDLEVFGLNVLNFLGIEGKPRSPAEEQDFAYALDLGTITGETGPERQEFIGKMAAGTLSPAERAGAQKDPVWGAVLYHFTVELKDVRPDIRDAFIGALQQRVSGRIALALAEKPKPEGLADAALERLYCETLAKPSQDAEADTAEILKFASDIMNLPYAEVNGALKVRTGMLAAGRDPQAIPTILRLIETFAEPRLKMKPLESGMKPTNINSTRSILEAA